MSDSTSRSTEVRSLSRALDLLETLADSDGRRLTELAEASGLRHNTAHRLLATLIAHGYVRRDRASGCYQLGYAVARLASGIDRLDRRLRDAAGPSMQRVHRVCRETTNLLVLDGDHVVYVDQIAGTGTVRMFAEPGARVPAHASGAGKAMLAHLEPAEVAALLPDALAAFTPHTITALGPLHAELALTRARGFALDREEYELAVSCVAAAILGPDGTVAGALSVSGPTGRLGDIADYDAFGELLARNALDASRALGYTGPAPSAGQVPAQG